jgi:hypothetical protein
MKVLVLGPTGGSGRLIVRDALAEGHSVSDREPQIAGECVGGAEEHASFDRDGHRGYRRGAGIEGVQQAEDRPR